MLNKFPKFYSFSLKFKAVTKLHKKFYYSVLGLVLTIFKNDDVVYQNIVSISPLRRGKEDIYFLKITVLGESVFNKMLKEILKEEQFVSVDGEKLHLVWVDLGFKFFDKEGLIYNFGYNKINLSFLSPTFTKTTKNGISIQNLLPSPEVFLLAMVRKFDYYFPLKVDLLDIKKEIIKNVYPVSFNLKTERNKIKKGVKAGVVGKVSYCLQKEIDEEVKKILFFSLSLANFTGLGAGVKLGWGQVKVNFSS